MYLMEAKVIEIKFANIKIYHCIFFLQNSLNYFRNKQEIFMKVSTLQYELSFCIYLY